MITDDSLRQCICDFIGGAGTAAYAANYPLQVGDTEEEEREIKWSGALRPTLDLALPSAVDVLRSEPGGDLGIIHSWMVWQVAFGQARKNNQQMAHYWGYRLRGYLQWWDRGDADNSAKFLSAELDAIKRKFAASERLGFTSDADGFHKHDNVQGQNLALQTTGNTRAHIVNLYLGVHLLENSPLGD